MDILGRRWSRKHLNRDINGRREWDGCLAWSRQWEGSRAATADEGPGDQKEPGGPTHAGRQEWSREVAGTHVQRVTAWSRGGRGGGGEPLVEQREVIYSARNDGGGGPKEAEESCLRHMNLEVPSSHPSGKLE